MHYNHKRHEFHSTTASDSGFVLNFEFKYWIVSWILKYWSRHDLSNKYQNYSDFIYCGAHWFIIDWDGLSFESELLSVVISSSSSSSSSSRRTSRWVHFQQNAGLRLFVHTGIVHGIDNCYQLTRTFEGFSAKCVSKPFLKEYTVLLVTT